MIDWQCLAHPEGVVWWKGPLDKRWCWVCDKPGERRYAITLPNGQVAA